MYIDGRQLSDVIFDHSLIVTEINFTNTLLYIHCSWKQSVVDFFVYASKNALFCIRYFLKTKHKSAKKNSGRCFSMELQFTCKNSDKSEQNQKRAKIRHRSVMLSALQLL